MRRFTATILLSVLFSSAGLANVVRGAPEFTWLSSGARGQTLKSVRGQPVVLIVAQRVSTIMNAEQIIVLDEGKIVGKGTHKELLKMCPEYREIAESQLSKEELA